MSETYEDLKGAHGNNRFFRPKRFEAKKLFLGIPPRAWFDGNEFDLTDISVSGVGCCSRYLDLADEPSEGPVEGVLRLTQRGREIFSASATQVRSQIAGGDFVIGVALKGRQFDIDALVRGNAGALALEPVADRTGFEPSKEYKSHCAEVLNFVGGYLNRIDRHLAPIEDKLTLEESRDLIGALVDAAADPWRLLLEAGNDLVIPGNKDKEIRQSLKAFTERVVTRELVGGASWARCYFKPMGYPGDFQIMNFMYDGTPVGTSLRSKFLHMLGVIAGKPIVSRMDTVAQLIVDHAATREDVARTVNVMSIGCGPARELESILASSPFSTTWAATLVDQEPEALDYALSSASMLPGADRLKATALNISFKDMLGASPVGAQIFQQDIVYSAGLVDYLNPLLAMRFIRRMYDFLKPGGRLIIGNVNDCRTGTLWPMEYVLDWTLYFRNENDMKAMAGGVDDAKMQILSDPLNAILFLVLDKPAR